MRFPTSQLLTKKFENMFYSDLKFEPARKKGWLKRENEYNFRNSFVGAFVYKYPNRTGILEILQEVLGEYPRWELLTDDAMRGFRDAVLERMSSSSARTTFLRLKAVLNEYKDDRNIPSVRYGDILTAKSTPVINIYLNEREIERIEEYVPKSKTEEYVKTIFLISCYTGCRHSDAVRITEENISGNKLSYVSWKTKIKVTIPVHKKLRKYIGKYKGELLCIPEHNTYIKRICKACRIDKKVKVFYGGKEHTGEKWEFVSNHTARRSFATNLYMRGSDIYTVMALMGHTNIEQTRGYICDQRELDSASMSFFQ